jgi:DNA polymerase III subunit gamma/tau
MILPHGSGDLYHKYRPQRFSEIVGHKETVKSIKSALMATEPSQAFLLLGDSGTGKTTTARIMALSLNCEKRGNTGEPCLKCAACKAIVLKETTDIVEVNCADNRGIDDIRRLCATMPFAPMFLNRKVFILDECHQLTGDAQSSLLKELEEAPSHVFIILCSTHPAKIIPTVKNRCQRFKFPLLKKKEMLKLLEIVGTVEAYEFDPQIYSLVTDSANGSPRNGLVLLQQVAQLSNPTVEDAAHLLESGDQKNKNVFSLCFELTARNSRWEKIVSTYELCKDDSGVTASGMMMAGFFRNKLLKAKTFYEAELYGNLLELFVEPLPETGKLGENLFVLKLYKAYRISKEKGRK